MKKINAYPMYLISEGAVALGQIIGGPILGVIATLATIRVEMVAAAIMLSPVLLMYAWTVRQHKPGLALAEIEATAE